MYWAISLLFVFRWALDLSDACMQVIPADDLTTTESLEASSSTSSTQTTTAALTCVVPSATAYGTFSPGPGTTIPEGSTAILICGAYAHTSPGAVNTAICFNGALSPTTGCLPCPDGTWVFDPETNRCIKAFVVAYNPITCDFTPGCNSIASQYGVPGSIAYTPNFQALLTAAKIGLSENIVPVTYGFFVGVGDPLSQNVYQLADGTPIPFLKYLDFAQIDHPHDRSTNVYHFNVIAVNGLVTSSIGFADGACFAGAGGLCQLQLPDAGVTLTTTTTVAPAVASCPDPTPLFSFSPSAAFTKIVLTPSGPQPTQTLVTADCLANNPTVTSTTVTVTLDSGAIYTQFTGQFPTSSSNFERIYLACQPSGNWLVFVFDLGLNGGFGGTVTIPGNVVCSEP